MRVGGCMSLLSKSIISSMQVRLLESGDQETIPVFWYTMP